MTLNDLTASEAIDIVRVYKVHRVVRADRWYVATTN